MESFQAQWEVSCSIRRDKFDYVLPTAMRRNGVDMWIVIDHGRGTEPLMLDLGIETAYGQGIYIFHDSGEGRVERFALSGPGSSDLATLCNVYDPLPPIMEGPDGNELSQLQSIVFGRDPERIALNIVPEGIRGEGVHVADGLVAQGLHCPGQGTRHNGTKNGSYPRWISWPTSTANTSPAKSSKCPRWATSRAGGWSAPCPTR